MSNTDPHTDRRPQPGVIPEVILHEAEAAAAAAQEEEDRGSKGVDVPGFQGSPEHHIRHHRGVSPHLEQVPPPAYNGSDYGHLDITQNGLDTGARISSDGRVNIKINQHGKKLTNILLPALKHQLEVQRQKSAQPHIPEGLGETDGLPPPPMNIVIQIVGSRGDVQPFVALGQILKNKYKHRVRIATHPTFKQFVTENGLEFFSIGGDPAELMAFMVKNPGLMPGIDSLKNGDVGKRRKGIYEIITGCWRSCIEAGDGTGMQVSDDNMDARSFDSAAFFGVDPTLKPFIADAIIANPPSFAHVHIAEKLGIPLHLMFTMPWSPTQSFPHPLANIISSNTDANMANFVTYALVDMLTWQGLGDVINRFRERSLGLEPISIMWAPGMVSRLRIPWTYCWSPALIPKPADWGSFIDISGFYFLNLSTNYHPPRELVDFLDAGPPPVYIGFGSIVVDDPNAMTKMIFEAVQKTGQRALVSKGWGGLGADELGIPQGVYMLGNCPHDWLFKHVSCVVHHGGAGTTAAGILAGRPTVVVPFFGDQPFWGSMTARAGAGPVPIAFKNLTADKLAAQIMEALKPESLERAKELSMKIKAESGCESGAESFHTQLRASDLRCSLAPERVAVWRVRRTDIRLSSLAATVLGSEGLLDFSDLKLYRPREYETEDGPWEPISGGAAALIGTIGNLGMGIADFPVEILKSLKTASGELKEIHEKRKSASGTSTPVVSSDHPSTRDLTAMATAPDAAPSTLSAEVREILRAETMPSAMSTVMSPDGTAKSHHHHRRWSRHRSRSGSPKPNDDRTPCPGEEVGQVSLETAISGAKAVGRIVSAGIKSPMDFTLSMAKGFHNAPKLYGDDTVRRNDKIVDLHSGLKTAGKEFGYGFYDGITGLATQPIAGAKKEGAAGFIKGAAKGLGGLVLKPAAGIWGLPGYTAKGIYAEVAKHFGRSVQNYIIAARTAQGFEDWKNSTPEERARIVNAWKDSKLEIRKGGKPDGNDQVRKEKKQKSSGQVKGQGKFCPFDHDTSHRFKHSGSFSNLSPSLNFGKTNSGEDAVLSDHEHAIRVSVSATSTGNPEQDAMIERALRASLLELQSPSANKHEDEAYESAIKASIEEFKKARAEYAERAQESGVISTAEELSEHDHELERVLTQSLEEYRASQAARGGIETPMQDHWKDDSDSGIDTDDDENFKRAIEESKRLHTENEQKNRERTDYEAGPIRNGNGPVATEPSDLAEDEELRRAITASEQDEKARQENLTKQKTEEEIVMEYVKKQNLLEEEFKNQNQGKNVTAVIADETPAPTTATT
ncbi:uncharacterized protein Z518_08421 [Rhinocladiella mackenziei CBS 650.93]|uniref:Glycosyltransferase family 28 N-terminal domain-containing protein n=1 Tax=Rhinocladiella mackenziei CBS 650.93 TaxID=1442369 RepID=A0A0D2J0S5_9EURO|nr:uncharacterized protein Z518_08421 [Rhinocladiella mackenziei CBS 650.93]KIX02480.1 hypothetical protein Z518_08421 [Rhinocladiella mackenziei CBS 650.93]